MLPKSFRVTLRLSESALAIPKSRTLMSPAGDRRTLRGFRSPCTSETKSRPSMLVANRCAVSRKRHSSHAMRLASSGATLPRLMTSERFSPSTYSIAMK